MRFWLATRLEAPGQLPITTASREFQAELVSRGYRILGFPQMGIAALGMKIRGHYETKDRNEVLVLMKVGGNLHCNPQDAVDEGILTAAEVKALGYDNVVAPPDAKPVAAPVPEVPEILPDFYTMKKEALVKWADAQVPPIHLDRRKRKDTLVAEVKAALEERIE
jgi:hypothetical protein